MPPKKRKRMKASKRRLKYYAKNLADLRERSHSLKMKWGNRERRSPKLRDKRSENRSNAPT